jgi:uncharacterized protein (TIGR02147 family)
MGSSAEAISVFDLEDYKAFLARAIAPKGHTRGLRSRLAVALRCQSAFVSRVLNGPADFSAEHGIQISRFLGMSEDEAQFFLLLLHRTRAGSHDLRAHYTRQIEEFRRRREVIAERIHVKSGLTLEDQAVYFSSWHYAAIHVLLTIPGFQSRAAIAKHLGVTPKVIGDCVDFLVRKGVAKEEKGQLSAGPTRLHLGKDSPMLAKHHTNWRIRAIESFDREKPNDLHYSSVIGVSRANALKIRERILKLLESTEPMLAEPTEEAAFVFGIDLFAL